MPGTIRKLRPTKVRNAVRRRLFEHRMARVELHDAPGLIDLGSAPGGWTVPGELIDPSWLCYSVGAGGDISFDLELIRRYGVEIRAFDAVAEYVALAAEQAGPEPRFSVRHTAIATHDGPLRMQLTHHPGSRSLSSAGLYETRDFVEQPGRTLRSLMSDLGDDHIDLLKLDIEGAEYEVVPTLELQGIGVKVFATQLHHNGSVRNARSVIAGIRAQGYEPVACRPAIKLTFAHRSIL
jgi:FkbM family methyltransferase